jgi:hypothetical protein
VNNAIENCVGERRIVSGGDMNRAGFVYACAGRFFSSASTVLVSAHDRGVDHHVFVVGVIRQQLENAIENAALRPSVKALVYDVPVAKTRGQITPRDSRSISVKNRINEQPVVCCIAAHMTFSAGQKIFDPLPLVVSQSKPLHGRPPQSRLPMNHSTTDLGIPKITPGSGS